MSEEIEPTTVWELRFTVVVKKTRLNYRSYNEKEKNSEQINPNCFNCFWAAGTFLKSIPKVLMYWKSGDPPGLVDRPTQLIYQQ